MLDVDEDDSDLALLDQNLLQPIEHHRHGGQTGGPVDEQHSRGTHRRFRLCFLGRTLTLQQRCDALHHLIAIEWLDQVVIRAELQSGEAIFDVAARRHQHDGDVRCALHGFEGLADFPSAPLRHHDVQQHDVGKPRLGDRQRLLPVPGHEDLAIERTQIYLEQLDHVLVVIRDEQDRLFTH